MGLFSPESSKSLSQRWKLCATQNQPQPLGLSDSAVGAGFRGLESGQSFVHAGMNLEDGIQIGKIQKFAHERAGAGTLQVSVAGSRPRMQKHQFADAGTVEGTDAAEIENHFAALLENFTDQAREGSSLVAIDDAALAVNDHDITAIASFQTEFQRRLLIWCCQGSQVLRLRTCLPVRVGRLHVIR